MSQHARIELCTLLHPHSTHTRHAIAVSHRARIPCVPLHWVTRTHIELCTVRPHSTHTRHDIAVSHRPHSTHSIPMLSRLTRRLHATIIISLCSCVYKMKSFQLSDDRIVVVKKTEYSPEFLLDMLLHIRLYSLRKTRTFLCRKIGRPTYIFVHIIKFKKLHNRTSICAVVLRLQYCSNYRK